MLPEGWKRTTFEDHIDLLSGNPFKSAEYSNNPSDIRLLRGDNIEPGKLRWRDAKFWPANRIHDLKRYCLQQGDFVIAMDRTWVSSGLKVAEVRSADLPCLLVQRVSRIRALPTLCQSLLKQYFSGYSFENYVKSVETETAVPHISAQQIKDFPFLLPPLPEQKKIAAILSTWDHAIEETEKLLANSQQQKKALMQQLLTGKKRLPGFTGAWKKVSLEKTGKVVSGGTPDTTVPAYWDGDVLWLTPTDVTSLRGKYVDDTKRKITQTGIKDSATTLLPAGSLLVCTRATIGYMAIAKKAITTNQGFKNIVFNKFFLPEFVYYFLCTQKHEMQRLASGSTFAEISKKDFCKIHISAPPLPEQKAIAAVLNTADEEITAIESDLSRLRQEKKALMQQLLTGKRRVKVD